MSRSGERRGRQRLRASMLAWFVLVSVIATVLLGLGSPCHTAAQWRDTEIPPGQATPLARTVTRGGEVRLVEPLWLRRVRTFRRLGGVVLGMGGVVILVGELAYARAGSFNTAFALDIGGSAIGAVGLFTLVGAQVRRRRVRIHLGLREPMPDHRGRRRRIGGGILLGLTGVMIGGTVLAIANDSGCVDGSECEGSVAAAIIPAVLGSVFTVGGVALLAAGGAARHGARGRVRISVGASRGVPTFIAQF